MLCYKSSATPAAPTSQSAVSQSSAPHDAPRHGPLRSAPLQARRRPQCGLIHATSDEHFVRKLQPKSCTHRSLQTSKFLLGSTHALSLYTTPATSPWIRLMPYMTTFFMPHSRWSPVHHWSSILALANTASR